MGDHAEDLEMQELGLLDSTYCKKHKGMWPNECGCEVEDDEGYFDSDEFYDEDDYNESEYW